MCDTLSLFPSSSQKKGLPLCAYGLIFFTTLFISVKLSRIEQGENRGRSRYRGHGTGTAYKGSPWKMKSIPCPLPNTFLGRTPHLNTYVFWCQYMVCSRQNPWKRVFVTFQGKSIFGARQLWYLLLGLICASNCFLFWNSRVLISSFLSNFLSSSSSSKTCWVLFAWHHSQIWGSPMLSEFGGLVMQRHSPLALK